jgi:hypothetical protein
MSFQFVIDNASSISINRKQVVASTTARDGTIRNVGRGGNTWRFEVTLPNGPRWSDYRNDISKLEDLGRTTEGTFSFNNSGHRWLVGYQGNSVNYTGFVASWTQGQTSITLTTSPATTSGYKFKAGDFIQLGASGKVYTVAEDVAYNSNSVKVHRPILDSTGNGSLRVAENCVWTVYCSQFPEWDIFARDQVGWSGSFIFEEKLV